MQEDQNEAILTFLNQASVKEITTLSLKLKCFLQNQLTI